MLKRAIVFASAAMLVLALMAGTASSRTSSKVITVKLSGTTFGGKSSLKLKAKVGDSVKFVWGGGVHNVVSSKVPSGAKKISSGHPVSSHAALTVKLAKKGTYSVFCAVHRALGMTATITVS